MVDVNPEIWNNPTLGEAGAGPFLDEEEANAQELINAKAEGREPRIFTHYPRRPEYPPVSVSPDVTSLEVTEPPVAKKKGAK